MVSKESITADQNSLPSKHPTHFQRKHPKTSHSYQLTTPTMPLKALFFDVFGTCVDWRKTVTEGLIEAAKEAGDTTMASHRTTPITTSQN